MTNYISVEIVYAHPEQQILIGMQLEKGSTVKQAILASGILYKGLDLGEKIEALKDRVGIFGMQVTLDHILNPGDRVEIYRQLMQNPKTSRRLRALQHPIKEKKK